MIRDLRRIARYNTMARMAILCDLWVDGVGVEPRCSRPAECSNI